MVLSRPHWGHPSPRLGSDLSPSNSASDLMAGTNSFAHSSSSQNSEATKSKPSAFDLKVVHFINDVFKQATDVTTVVPMLLGGPIGNVAKVGLLRSAVARPAATWLGRMASLHIIPTLGGFGAETLAFGLGSRGLVHCLQGPVAWDPGSVLADLGMAGLSLGLLKGANFLGTRGMQWALGPKADQLAMFWTGQVSGYLGLVLSHGVEEKYLGKPHTEGNIWINALGTHLALGIGAHGGRKLLGESFHRLEQRLALEAHWLSEQLKPDLNIPGLTSPILAMANGGMGMFLGTKAEANPHLVFMKGDSYPYREKISSQYLGTTIETELVSKEPTHNLARLSKMLRESFLDILVSGREEGFSLKGEIAEQLRNSPELRKRILSGAKVEVRFETESGTILQIKAIDRAGNTISIPQESQLSEASSPPTADLNPTDRGEPQRRVPVAEPPAPPPAKAPEPAVESPRPPAAAPVEAPPFDPWIELEQRLQQTKGLFKEHLSGNLSDQVSASRLALFIRRGFGQAPISEIHRIVILLEEAIRNPDKLKSPLSEVGRQWKNLCNVYDLDLSKHGPDPAIPVKYPLPTTRPEKINWPWVHEEIKRLYLKALNHWPKLVRAKESAIGYLKWMPRVDGHVPPSKIQAILEVLEESIDRDVDGTSQHLKVKKLWDQLKKKYEITLFERPDSGKEPGDSVAETAAAPSLPPPEMSEEATPEATPAEPVKTPLQSRLDGLRNLMTSKWPGYPAAKRSGSQILANVERALERDIPDGDLTPVLDALEKSITADDSGQSSHEEAGRIWRSIKWKHDLTFFERPDMKGNQLGARRKATAEQLAPEVLSEPEAIAQPEAAPQSERLSQREPMLPPQAPEPELTSGVSEVSIHEPTEIAEDSIPASPEAPSMPPEVFRYQHTIALQMVILQKADGPWLKIFDRVMEITNKMTDDRKVPEGAARNRAGTMLCFTLQMFWPSDHWPGLEPAQAEILLDHFEDAIDGTITMEQYYQIRRRFTAEVMPTPVPLSSEAKQEIPGLPVSLTSNRRFEDALTLMMDKGMQQGEHLWEKAHDQADNLIKDLNGDTAAVNVLRDILEVAMAQEAITPGMVRGVIEAFEEAWATNALEEFRSRLEVKQPMGVIRQIARESFDRRKTQEQRNQYMMMMSGRPKGSEPPAADSSPAATSLEPKATEEVKPAAIETPVPPPPAAEVRAITPSHGERAGLLGIGTAIRFYTNPLGTADGCKEFQGNLILPNLKRLSFLFHVDPEGNLKVSPPGRAYLESPDPRERNQTVKVETVLEYKTSRLRIRQEGLGPDFELSLQGSGASVDSNPRFELNPQQPDFDGPWEGFFPTQAPWVPQVKILHHQFLAQGINSSSGARNQRFQIFLNNGDRIDLHVMIDHHGGGELKVRHAWLNRLGEEEDASREMVVPKETLHGKKHRIHLQEWGLGYKLELPVEIPVGDQRGLMSFKDARIKMAPPPPWLKLEVPQPPAKPEKKIRTDTIPPPPLLPKDLVSGLPHPATELSSEALDGNLSAIKKLGEMAKTVPQAVTELKTLYDFSLDPEVKAVFNGHSQEALIPEIISALKVAAGESLHALGLLQAYEQKGLVQAREALLDLAITPSILQKKAEAYILQQLNSFRLDVLQTLWERLEKLEDQTALIEILVRMEMGDKSNPDSWENRLGRDQEVLHTFLQLAGGGLLKARNAVTMLSDLRPLEVELNKDTNPQVLRDLIDLAQYNPKARRLVKQFIQTTIPITLKKYLPTLLSLGKSGDEFKSCVADRLKEITEKDTTFGTASHPAAAPVPTPIPESPKVATVLTKPGKKNPPISATAKINRLINQKSQAKQRKLRNSYIDFFLAPYALQLTPSQVGALVDAYVPQLAHAVKNTNLGKMFFYLDVVHELSHHLGTAEKAALAKRISQLAPSSIRAVGQDKTWDCLKDPNSASHWVNELSLHENGVPRTVSPLLVSLLRHASLIASRHSEPLYATEVRNFSEHLKEVLEFLDPGKRRELALETLGLITDQYNDGHGNPAISRDLVKILTIVSPLLNESTHAWVLERVKRDPSLSHISLGTFGLGTGTLLEFLENLTLEAETQL